MTSSEPLHPHDVYARVGGLEAFVALIDAFYLRVEADPVLRPEYPEDLAPGKARLARFFAQYFGGGDIYSRDRGHPRLRMRHAPFTITPEHAVRWAEHMAAAIEAQGFDADVEAVLLEYVANATPTLINRFDPPGDTLPLQRGP